MVDVTDCGLRPRGDGTDGDGGRGAAEQKAAVDRGAAEREAVSVCPGAHLARPAIPEDQLGGRRSYRVWGPILEVREGAAADPDIRFEASSGGAATALALYGIEAGGMHGVLHVCAREDDPVRNRPTFSRTREELLAATGSRYAPAGPCEAVRFIEEAAGPCVFIGKPCDVAGVRKLAARRPKLAAHLGLTIAFFCAGTPSTAATLTLLQQMGVPPGAEVLSLRYRGRGWPGHAAVEYGNGDGGRARVECSYDESWGAVLQKHRQWRCYICPDHLGECADIAVGDAWHRSLSEGQPGLSVMVARTPRGQAFLARARQAGYLTTTGVPYRVLEGCRPGHAAWLGNLHGRLMTLRLLGVSIPRYEGFSLDELWRTELSPCAKARAVLSTVKRIYVKKLRVPLRVDADGTRRPWWRLMYRW